MLLQDSVFIFLLIGCGICQNLERENLTIDQAFKRYMIVPTFLRTSPSIELSVRFNNRVVDLGNELPVFYTVYPPYISYEASSSSLYSLVFVGLDRPSGIAPYESPYVYLLAINIPGANITAGDFLTTYSPPVPYAGSGYHRFVFLVYRQPTRINPASPDLVRVRGYPQNFSLIDYSARYNLGNPIAGNFYTSELSVCGSGLDYKSCNYD